MQPAVSTASNFPYILNARSYWQHIPAKPAQGKLSARKEIIVWQPTDNRAMVNNHWLYIVVETGIAAEVAERPRDRVMETGTRLV
jgi:hypothetical protein